METLEPHLALQVPVVASGLATSIIGRMVTKKLVVRFFASRVTDHMRNSLRLLFPLPLLLAAAPSPPLATGLWEHSVVYIVDKVNGSSLIADQAQNMLPSPPPYRACYTRADLTDPGDFLLNTGSEQCRFSHFELANGKLVAEGDCTDSRYPTIHVDGSGTYTAGGYDFSFSGQAQSGDLSIEFRGRDSGRRVGSCPAGSRN